MTEKPRDFGLSGVTDKLKHFPSESEAVIHNKDNLNTGLTEKGKSDTVEPVAVSLDKDNLRTCSISGERRWLNWITLM
jgi:hypothetical protein